MIVNYKSQKFQVMFFHHNKETKWCKCEIWLMSELPTNELEYKFQKSIVRGYESKNHPGIHSKLLLTKTIARCADKDNYIYAYARWLSLIRALRVLINNKIDKSVLYYITDFKPFIPNNEMFKAFMHELNIQCPHGVKAAQLLQHTKGYNINEE